MKKAILLLAALSVLTACNDDAPDNSGQTEPFQLKLDKADTLLSFKSQIIGIDGITDTELIIDILADWIEPFESRLSESFTRKFKISENLSTESRCSDIIFSSTDGLCRDTFIIVQQGKPEIMNYTDVGIYKNRECLAGAERYISQTGIKSNGENAEFHILNAIDRTYCLIKGIKSDELKSGSSIVNVQQNMTPELNNSFDMNLSVFAIENGIVWAEDSTLGLSTIFRVE